MPHDAHDPVHDPGPHEDPRRRPADGEPAARKSAADYDDWLTDVVHDASIESFPASDPPAWIGMRAGRPRR